MDIYNRYMFVHECNKYTPISTRPYYLHLTQANCPEVTQAFSSTSMEKHWFLTEAPVGMLVHHTPAGLGLTLLSTDSTVDKEFSTYLMWDLNNSLRTTPPSCCDGYHKHLERGFAAQQNMQCLKQTHQLRICGLKLGVQLPFSKQYNIKPREINPGYQFLAISILHTTD